MLPASVLDPAPAVTSQRLADLAPALGQEHLDRWLARIGLRAERPSLAYLTRLQRRHLYTVPFENLDIAWGIPIPLDLARAWSKVVERRRGGFCYELNGLFGWALERLGFDVALLSARVWRKPLRAWGPEYDHLALRVRVDGREVLADVGFGELFRAPVRLPDGTASDVSGAYRLVSEEGEVRVEHAPQPDAWRPVYRLSLRPRAWAEFGGMCAWHQSSPDSPFAGNAVFTLARSWGRSTFTERYRMETRAGVSTRRRYEAPDLWLREVRERFGVLGPLEPGPRRPRGGARA